MDLNILTTARKFRAMINKFKETAKIIISLNEEDTEILYISKEVDAISKRIDTL